MVNFDTVSSDVLSAVSADRQRGFTLIESLERHGLMKVSEESGSSPWEIDEDKEMTSFTATY